MTYTVLSKPQASALRAAVSWWRGNRPVAWSKAEHLKAPTVNCCTRRERRMAAAVAKLLIAGDAP